MVRLTVVCKYHPGVIIVSILLVVFFLDTLSGLIPNTFFFFSINDFSLTQDLVNE